MGRKPCCSKEGLNRGAWTAMEDDILVSYIKKHGEGKWGSLPKRAGLKRCGKSCRLRWLNYLRPGIKRGNISDDEEELIVRLHRLLGNRWSLIAGRLPGRTDNEIKNYWNTTLRKRAGNHGGCSNQQQVAVAPPSRRAAPKPTQASSADDPAEAAPDDTSSPIRTKALRCTIPTAPAAASTAGQDRPPANDDGQLAEEAAGQQEFRLAGENHLSISSIDLDLDDIELGFLMSPWRGGGAVGDMGGDQFGVGGGEGDLEELLGLGAGGGGGDDDGVPSLGNLELPWI